MIEANDLVIYVFMAGAYVLVPGLLARYLVRASWIQTILAFPMYWLVLFLLLGFGRISEEILGWTLIMAMFTSCLGVPLAALVLKLTNLPDLLRPRD
uniref:hypothetical protein n=1 Tax=uncultured Altererythrobacter sp. TaxID=500840 RepID=UPI00261601F9|nr:hypothetical protein [uncultured Altererythrobacter sp.]